MNISFRLTAILCILAVGFMTMGLLVPTVDADSYAIVVHSYTVYLCSGCGSEIRKEYNGSMGYTGYHTGSFNHSAIMEYESNSYDYE